jgi:hypothetical protein
VYKMNMWECMRFDVNLTIELTVHAIVSHTVSHLHSTHRIDTCPLPTSPAS